MTIATKKRSQIIQSHLSFIPPPLVHIIQEYQDTVEGTLVKVWREPSFACPRKLSIHKDLCCIIDGDQERPPPDQPRVTQFPVDTAEFDSTPTYGYPYRLQVFDTSRMFPSHGFHPEERKLVQDADQDAAVATLIRQFGRYVKHENDGVGRPDEFHELEDAAISPDGKSIVIVDSDIPTIRLFSFPDFRSLSCLENQVSSDKRMHFSLHAFGITFGDNHFYVTKGGYIHKFQIEKDTFSWVQTTVNPCSVGSSDSIRWDPVDNMLWFSDRFRLHASTDEKRCIFDDDHFEGSDLSALAIYYHEVYLVDAEEQSIVVVDKTGKQLRTFGQGILQEPQGIFIYEGRAWVTDPKANCIFIFE